MKDFLQEKLSEVVKKLTNEDVHIEISIPKDISKGDFTTNVAFSLSKILKKSPLEVAEALVKEFGKYSGIEYIEPASPGFINFYLSQDSLITNLQKVLNAPEKIAGIRKNPKFDKAVVEYSSPNIAKPFTIGHLRSTIIGDAIANLLTATGYKVYRDNHLGDWGTQFGKQIYAIKNIPLKAYPAGSDIGKHNEEAIENAENSVKELVSLYVKFHEEAEKKPELEEEGRKWFKRLEDGDWEARRLWQKCIDWSFKEFDRIYRELGVSFTEHNGRGYGEAFFEDKMQPVLDELRKKNLLTEDKGAHLVFFPKDIYPPLMIVKADGATLYATRDLATDKFRLEHYGKDILVVNEVGMEQNLYFKQLFETEYLLGWYKKGQRVHVGHGLYRFKEGKMSTRKGNVIWLEDVLQEAVKRATMLTAVSGDRKGGFEPVSNPDDNSFIDKNYQKDKEFSQGSRNSDIRDIAIGALKWNDLKRSAHMDVAFNWDEILSMNGNSGPYVQYAYTRTQSVLAKAGSNYSSSEAIAESRSLNLPLEEGSRLTAVAQTRTVLYTDYTPSSEELNMLRKLVQFPGVVEDAATLYAPNMVAEYLFELAQMFNNFYQKYRIINADTPKEKQFRLDLTKAIGIILKQGLTLLGIQAPQKM